MPSTYTGVAGNVAASSGPTSTIPSDGDTLNVASVNAALQKLTDYVAQLETQAGGAFFHFSGTAGSAASTNYYLIASGGQGSTAALTLATFSGSALYFGRAAMVRGIAVNIGNTTVGGSIVVSLYTGAAQPNVQITYAAGSTPGGTLFTAVTPVAVAGNPISIQVANGIGVTTGLGVVAASLFVTLA